MLEMHIFFSTSFPRRETRLLKCHTYLALNHFLLFLEKDLNPVKIETGGGERGEGGERKEQSCEGPGPSWKLQSPYVNLVQKPML